jgi:hypothetical protein
MFPKNKIIILFGIDESLWRLTGTLFRANGSGNWKKARQIFGYKRIAFAAKTNDTDQFHLVIGINLRDIVLGIVRQKKSAISKIAGAGAGDAICVKGNKQIEVIVTHRQWRCIIHREETNKSGLFVMRVTVYERQHAFRIGKKVNRFGMLIHINDMRKVKRWCDMNIAAGIQHIRAVKIFLNQLKQTSSLELNITILCHVQVADITDSLLNRHCFLMWRVECRILNSFLYPFNNRWL